MAEIQDAKQDYGPRLTLPKNFSVCYLNVIVTFKVTSSAYLTTTLLTFSRKWHKFTWLTPKQCFAYNCNCFNCDLQTHLPHVI